MPETTPSRQAASKVRTAETVKAYPVGRYTDPNYPDEMHERHTLYRREVPADWYYLPDAPHALPLGPTVATSAPSASYYVNADAESMNAQQRAYADALVEQNRVLKKRIGEIEKEADKVPKLQKQIDDLKQQLESLPEPLPPPQAESEPVEGFSSVPSDEQNRAFSYPIHNEH